MHQSCLEEVTSQLAHGGDCPLTAHKGRAVERTGGGPGTASHLTRHRGQCCLRQRPKQLPQLPRRVQGAKALHEVRVAGAGQKGHATHNSGRLAETVQRSIHLRVILNVDERFQRSTRMLIDNRELQVQTGLLRCKLQRAAERLAEIREHIVVQSTRVFAHVQLVPMRHTCAIDELKRRLHLRGFALRHVVAVAATHTSGTSRLGHADSRQRAGATRRTGSPRWSCD